MTGSLLWKDFRLAIPSLLTGGVLFASSFVSVFLLSRTLTPGPFPWFESVIVSAHFCQWSLVAVGALLGGTMFAAEKEDASQRFIHALPLSRGDIVLSKLIVAFLVLESLWIGVALIVHASAPYAAFGSRDHLPGSAEMATIAAISFSVLGTSWCWSALLSKPILAALNGVLTAVVIIGGATLATGSSTAAETTLDAAAPWAILTGLMGLALGTRIYTTESLEPGPDWPRDRRRVRLTAGRALAPDAPRAHSSGFRSLLWKDLRLVRALLVGGVIVLATPYLYTAALWLRGESSSELVARASTQSLWMSCIVFAAWGGYAVAAERASRTDRFLHALPVAAGTAALSRLLTTFLPAAVVYTVNVAAMLLLHAQSFRLSPVDAEISGLLNMSWEALIWQPNSLLFGIPALGMPLLCFAVAWWGSISLDRPFLGIGLGSATPGLVLVLWLSFISSTGEALIPIQAGALFLVLGAVAAFAIIGLGCRRAENLDYA